MRSWSERSGTSLESVTGPGTCDYTRDREDAALISEFMEPRPHAKARAALIVVASVAAIAAALLGFHVRVAPEDAKPDFGDQRVDTQVYVVGDEVQLKLPLAKRANGPLVYALYPQVPGLTLNGTTLRGIPAEPGAYSMVYTVADSDGDTTGADRDWLTFTVLVESTRSGWSVEELGEDVNAFDDRGTALCKAARYAGHAEVKMLLERGADPNLHREDRHDTHPISCALASRKPVADIRLIMEALADGGAVVPSAGVFFENPSGLEPEEFMFLLSPFFEASRGTVRVVGPVRERE